MSRFYFVTKNGQKDKASLFLNVMYMKFLRIYIKTTAWPYTLPIFQIKFMFQE